MLNPEPELTAEKVEMIAAPSSYLEPLPLWRVMDNAGERYLELAPLTHSQQRHLLEVIAAEIEALRDWLLPEEATPLAAVRSDLPFPMIERMDERQRLRQLLTKQARIAREGQ